MATRSTIALHNPLDNTIRAIYSHWDGYPEYNGRILEQHYTNADIITRLLDLGDISGLSVELKETAEAAYSVRGEDVPALTFNSIDEWLDYYTNAWCEYAYLYHSGKWHTFDLSNREVAV